MPNEMCGCVCVHIHRYIASDPDLRAGALDQCLRALAALPENPSLVPSTRDELLTVTCRSPAPVDPMPTLQTPAYM